MGCFVWVCAFQVFCRDAIDHPRWKGRHFACERNLVLWWKRNLPAGKSHTFTIPPTADLVDGFCKFNLHVLDTTGKPFADRHNNRVSPGVTISFKLGLAIKGSPITQE